MKLKISRRDFLSKTALATLAIPILGSSVLSCNSKSEKTNKKNSGELKKLKILILGGTSFLGPHQVNYAVSRGHEVSIFTRGKTKPKLFAEAFEKVEHLIGDRKNDLTALENRAWDVVIDNSGREVKWTEDTANLLKDKCGMYIYTSSTGVYYPYLTGNLGADTNVALEVPEGLTEDEQYEMEYGVMKANSERAAQAAFGKDRTTVIRPTYMIGPGDKTNRFLHWPIRLKQGGEVLVPGKQNDLVQYIDIRDVAEWFIHLAEQKQAGVFNAAGPAETQTIKEFVTKSSEFFENPSSFVFADDYDFLIKNNVFYQIPWVMADEKHYGSARVEIKSSIKNGLTYRPLKNTVIDTLDWFSSDAFDNDRRLDYLQNENSLLNREQNLLKLWKVHLQN